MVHSSYKKEMESGTFLSQSTKQEIQVLQVGISGKTERKKGPFLVVVYQTERKINEKNDNGKSAVFRCRHIPVFVGSAGSERASWLERTMYRLENHPRHSILIHQIPKSQLRRLLLQMYDSASPSSVPESGVQVDSPATLLPRFSILSKPDNSESPTSGEDEDLNKMDDEELEKRKSRMDVLFHKNRVTPDSPNFIYDIRVDFDSSGAAEDKVSVWDD